MVLLLKGRLVCIKEGIFEYDGLFFAAQMSEGNGSISLPEK
jgi:hypothetical protein